MPSVLDFELGKTAYKVINELCKVKPSESVLITVDGPQEWRVGEEIAKAAEAADAKVMVAKVQHLWNVRQTMPDNEEFRQLVITVMKEKEYDRLPIQ